MPASPRLEALPTPAELQCAAASSQGFLLGDSCTVSTFGVAQAAIVEGWERYALVEDESTPALANLGLRAVYHAPSRQQRPALVAKKFDVVREEVRIAITRLRSLDHPSFLALADAAETENEYVLVFEACTDCRSLLDQLALGPLSEEVAQGCVRDLCSAMAYAHRQGVQHNLWSLHHLLVPSNALAGQLPPLKVISFLLKCIVRLATSGQKASSVDACVSDSPFD